MANFIQRIFNNKPTEQREFTDDYNNPLYGTLTFNSFSTYSHQKSLKLSAVYRCVNLISDSIASLPLNPYTFKGDWKYVNYDNSLYNVLNVQPNPYMGKFTFMKLVVVNMLLKGNTYIHIQRNNNGSVKTLSILESDNIEVQVVNNDVRYYDKVSGLVYDKAEIIHILNYTNNGLVGVSTLTYASTALGISYNSEQHSNNFFLGGASLSGLLKMLGNTSKEKATQVKNNMITALNQELGGKSNSIIVIEGGFDYQPISVSPRDSQLLESRAFNVLEICRFFSVPPSLAFDQGSKYSTSEQQQIDFLTNCLSPIIEKLENEFFRKLFLPSEYNISDLKFDVENLLRLDATTRADYYTKMYGIGALTTNEIREKINAANPVKGGNKSFISTNLQSLDNLIVEQVQPVNQVDNKLKNNDINDGAK